MKHLKVTFMALLLIAGSVIAGNASIIYQDDFQVNDFNTRYNNYQMVASWWTYDNLGGGNKGLAPAGYWYKDLLDTKDYLNGHFTNTSYSASVALKCFPVAVGPSISLSLLNNGFVGSSLALYGYSVELVNAGSIVVMLNRINSDGTTTGLFENWGSSFGGANLNEWSNLTATVDVRSTETYLAMKWDGVDQLGNASSFFVDYHDTSAQRWTSGTGIGIGGFCGNGGPATSAIVIDNLVVSTVPEPSSLVVFACGLISFGGLIRRRLM